MRGCKKIFPIFFLFKCYFLLVIRDYLFPLSIVFFFIANELYVRKELTKYSNILIELDITHRLRIVSGYITFSIFFFLLVGFLFINRFNSFKKLKVYQHPIAKVQDVSLLFSAFNYTLLILPLSLLFVLNIHVLKLPLNMYIFFTSYILLLGFSIASWHNIRITVTVSSLLSIITLGISMVISIPLSLISVLIAYSISPVLIKVLTDLFMGRIPKVEVLRSLGYASFSPYILATTAFLFLLIALGKLALGEKLILSVSVGGVTTGVRDFGFDEETLLASIFGSLFGSLALFIVPPLLNVVDRYIDSHMHYVKFLTNTRFSTRILNVISAFSFGWLYALVIYSVLHVFGLIELEGVPMFILTTGLLAGMFTLNRVEKDFEFTKCFVFYLIVGTLIGRLIVTTDITIQNYLTTIAAAYTISVFIISILFYDLPVKVGYFIRYRVIPWLKLL
ncbi:MAG: hypothetical protein QXT75_06595 [Desulfurococcaceae archaeon]